EPVREGAPNGRSWTPLSQVERKREAKKCSSGVATRQRGCTLRQEITTMTIVRAALLGAIFAVSVTAGSREAIALQEAPIDEILRAAPSGIYVVVGAGDGMLAARIAEGGRRLVHVLEADEAKIGSARRLLELRKRSGLATVELWNGSTLPYP